jgi:glutamate-ammonia-ligase adenylyltransferase
VAPHLIGLPPVSGASYEIGNLPAELRAAVGRALDASGANAQASAVLSRHRQLAVSLPTVLACSPFAAGVLDRYPEMLGELSAGAGQSGCPVRNTRLAAELAQLAPASLTETEFLRRLRVFRHRELLRVIWRDVTGAAEVSESLEDLSALADAAICAALRWSVESLKPRHGEPHSPDGKPVGLAVVAMGKLGGRELNFSSDVDLVFVFSETGETDGPKRLSNEEYFRLLAQRLIGLLNQKTADGFVYRVDVLLRPFGASGPLAVSLPALENYLVQNGRDWERYAYVKARVINHWADTDYFYNDVLRPFVYRRYLDFGVFSSLREMKAMIEAEVARKEYRDNLKLGPGGIREIEFIVQSMQLVRGGTIAELRERQLLRVLPRLARHDCLPAQTVTELDAAYRFLRRAENALQAMHDQQSQELPLEAADRARLALALGFPDWDAFRAGLEVHRDAVSRHFREIVFGGAAAMQPGDGAADLGRVWRGDGDADAQSAILHAAGCAAPASILDPVRRLRASGGFQRMDQHGRQRLDVLMPALIALAIRQRDPALAMNGVARVVEAIGRRSAYFALLNENPAARERLVSLCGLSDFLAAQVAAHPLLLDELIDPRLFGEPPTRDELAGELALRLEGIAPDDQERRLEALRNFQQAALFRVAVADLSGTLPLMKVSDRLTETAELVLQAALEQAWHELVAKHGRPHCHDGGQEREAEFAIVAYGKLGGLELGYGSDLDLVFLHDSTGEVQQTDGDKPLDNAVFFARLARRIINIATMLTPTGQLYDVDTRLQPSGKKGLLVSSLAAFELYQRDSAWTWEHQALLRSRAIAGSRRVQDAFEDVRRRVLTTHVHWDKLREDVLAMRERMVRELVRDTPEVFDIKQSRGGITDIEFIVQYLVLRDARQHPDLIRWSDNIRQLEALAVNGILTREEESLLADTYRGFRRRVHRLALAGQPGFMPRAEAEPQARAVREIWDRVFGG